MGSQPAFRLFGFPVHVRSGFYMFLVIVVVVNSDGTRSKFGFWLAGFMAALTLLHELGHAFAARATGARAEISLDFMAGYASFVPTRTLKKWERAAISFAGPAVQITVSLLALWAMGAIPFDRFHDLSIPAQALLWAGPVIGLFNLLPILPLDGGNIVLAGLEVILGTRAKLVMLYASFAITIGGGLWLLNQPRFGTIAIYAAIFPLLAQIQMFKALRHEKHPPTTPLAAAATAEATAWRTGDVSQMLPQQVPSPWFRANQQLRQVGPDVARAVLLDSFAQPGPAHWMAPDAADERTLETLVALLPRPFPTGNRQAEDALGDVLRRLGDYDTAAHYAADSYRRFPSPIAALTVARSAAALGDQPTASGWLRAAEGLADPAWLSQAVQQSPELHRLSDPAGER
jgi:Zn-dependent protease